MKKKVKSKDLAEKRKESFQNLFGQGSPNQGGDRATEENVNVMNSGQPSKPKRNQQKQRNPH